VEEEAGEDNLPDGSKTDVPAPVSHSQAAYVVDMLLRGRLDL